MEFWGVEVKPGQTVKCEPGDEGYLHLSQASLGEIKKDKGTGNVPVFVKFNDQKLVLGTLSTENCAQIQYDIVFEKEFELSHGSKNTSVFFVGYKSIHENYASEDDLDGSDVEAYLNDPKEIGEGWLKKKNLVKPGKVAAADKDDTVAAKAKTQTGKQDKVEKPKLDDIQNKADDDDEEDKDEDDSNEESDDDDDYNDDEELVKGMIDSDSDDEDKDDSSEDEKANLKVENGKKRSADAALKSPIGKKSKTITPAGNLKIGDTKKGSQTPIPQITKQAGNKAKQQTPKSSGSVMCKTCSKSFNTENALQSHTKAKHSGAK
ncbi:histone deacetylase HDT2 isoform X2 [Dendrobium catenatum]|uniref:Histone deacetylase HDT1 n=1 Tax=Dendrobium catenatum TaxID=906689 RepID=A0A2I0X406_9ASPA|nr:histone deacetylase HDT2 isoform X2 [Dendrobium catenatum]PKU82649.1 Histone deacetylase HDT1 [Dendrobium catenatum]